MQLSRREFLQGATGVAAAVSSGCETVGVKRRDPNFSVLLSDLHIVPDDPVYRSAFEYTRRQLRERIDEILAMHPRPARVVTFGDMAFGHGETSSYEYAAGLFDELKAAGIAVFHGMGNHDRRDAFAKAFPSALTTTKVEGRFVSVVDLGSADLVLLDSLRGRNGEISGPVEGGLDESQQKWLADVLPGWERPVFVGAHHPACDLSVCGKRMVTFLKECPQVMGWICGHDHVWRKECLVGWWASNEDSIRSLTLPSAGFWGDIGLVTLKTDVDCATAVLDQKGYWFNNGPRQGERIPRLWKQIEKENQGQYCVFPYERPLRKRWNQEL